MLFPGHSKTVVFQGRIFSKFNFQLFYLHLSCKPGYLYFILLTENMNWVVRKVGGKNLSSQLQKKSNCRISHKILIKKLLKYQLNDQIVREVVVSGTKSRWSSVTQGSILTGSEPLSHLH